MGILNKFIFDGVDSSDYDVLVSGEGVFNSPERDVEVIEVPGRNGAFILDKGRFKNIEVTYPIKNHEANLEDFRSKLAGLRNALGSRVGYKRLEDTFHPNEYRMAQFSGPMEVDPIKYNYATDAIDLVFNCKPQRYLDTGDMEWGITSGASFNNPTANPCEPLLNVEGYGNIDIEGQEISINPAAIGPVEIAGAFGSWPQGTEASAWLNLAALNNGDGFKVQTPAFKIWLYGGSITRENSLNVSSSDPNWLPVAQWGNVQGNEAIYVYCDNGAAPAFVKGTSSEHTTTLTITTDTLTLSVTLKLKYISSTDTIKFEVTTAQTYLMQGAWQNVTGTSTKSALGNVYIDCEIGEAYKIENGEYISVNNAVVLPANLPTLKPGANVITYDNTITSLKITPRWWRL